MLFIKLKMIRPQKKREVESKKVIKADKVGKNKKIQSNLKSLLLPL